MALGAIFLWRYTGCVAGVSKRSPYITYIEQQCLWFTGDFDVRLIAENKFIDPAQATVSLELTILMPCLNEAETLARCIYKARQYLEREAVKGEVLVADNGSTDGSVEIARGCGACLVEVAQKGYGNALLAGIRAARGRYIIMADADDSYDLSNLSGFLRSLREGNDLVIGDRFSGGIQPGAMPWHHRFIGNPVLSFVGRRFFQCDIADFHCGLRGIERTAALRLGLCEPGMEFASEMIVKSVLAGLRIGQVPTVLSPAGRSRPSHLRSWRDGWRHLRFLLMMSPRWLMLYPGIALILIGLITDGLLLPGPLAIRGIGFGVHTLLYGAGASILGLQLVLFSLVARSIGAARQLFPLTPGMRRFLRTFTLERGIISGILLLLLGLGLAIDSFYGWKSVSFGTFGTQEMRTVIASVQAMIAGGEIFFASFILSLTGLSSNDL